MKRIVVGISGASGSLYALRLLEALHRCPDVETHLVVSAGGAITMHHELGVEVDSFHRVADVVHDDQDLGASIASGSFRVHGMVVVPCSMKVLSGIANSFDSSLIVRAGDVRLKERQPLILVVRETPLHSGHLRLMQDACSSGATIFPPVPAMYAQPRTIDDVVNHSVMRICDQLGIDVALSPRWGETSSDHSS